MKCKELQDLVPDYLAGALAGEQLPPFEAHLMECETCREDLRQMESTWVELGRMPDGEPGPGLRGRFYAMLEEEKRRLAGASKTPWYRRMETWLESWWPKRPAFQMAMIVVLTAAGLFAGSRLGTAPRADGDVARLRSEVQEMYQTVSLSLLDRKSAGDRLRGVNWSARVDRPSRDLLNSLASTMTTDPNENVRLAAVDALAYFGDRTGVPEAFEEALAGESSPVVQVALIDVLIAMREKQTLEALKRFIEQRDVAPPVKQHAETRLNEIL